MLKWRRAGRIGGLRFEVHVLRFRTVIGPLLDKFLNKTQTSVIMIFQTEEPGGYSGLKV